MTFSYKKVLKLSALSMLLNGAKAGLAPNACDMKSLTSVSGASVKFYDYPLQDTISLHDIDFLSGGYFKEPYVGSISGVENIQWDSGWPAVDPPYGFTDVPISNFLMEITGYYYAPQTGVYTLSTNVDDSATIFMGAGDAFNCCGQNEDFTASNYIFTNVYGAGIVSREVYLEADFYYPFKMVYINYMERAVLNLNINLPDGTVDTTVGNNLWAFPDRAPSECAVVSKSYSFTTELTTSTSTTTQYALTVATPVTVATTTTTVWPNDDDGEVDIIYVVEYPAEITSLTNTTTSTITTGSVPLFTEEYTTTVSTGSIYTIETIYVVKTLHSIDIKTTTTTETASVPAVTTTTSTSYVTGSDGFETPDIIVIIKTPLPVTSTITSYTPGHVTKATTVSTITTVITDSEGSTCTENIVLVEIPGPSTVTSFTAGSVSIETPISTITKETVGTDGETTTEIIIVVETPFATVTRSVVTKSASSSAISTSEILTSESTTVPISSDEALESNTSVKKISSSANTDSETVMTSSTVISIHTLAETSQTHYWNATTGKDSLTHTSKFAASTNIKSLLTDSAAEHNTKGSVETKAPATITTTTCETSPLGKPNLVHTNVISELFVMTTDLTSCTNEEGALVPATKVLSHLPVNENSLEATSVPELSNTENNDMTNVNNMDSDSTGEDSTKETTKNNISATKSIKVNGNRVAISSQVVLQESAKASSTAFSLSRYEGLGHDDISSLSLFGVIVSIVLTIFV
ncbi:hypothetical protein MOUN0_M02674 [Monosporozyma unispora]|nr:hypothetical protein C6P44_004291 [Kazachstania unispora]